MKRILSMTWQEILSYIAHKRLDLTLRDQTLKRKTTNKQASSLDIAHSRQETK